MPGLVEDATGNNLTYRIIGAAMAVQNDLGPGYKEEVYERALAAKLQELGIPAESQYAVDIVYQGSTVQYLRQLRRAKSGLTSVNPA
jgi:GxxExxY protein